MRKDPNADALVLAHPHRRDILDLIEENPGIPLLQVQHLLGISRGGLGYHLRLMRGFGLLEVRTSGHATLLYPASRVPARNDPSLLPPAAKRVARHLVAHPRSSAHEISQALGFSRGYALVNLKLLADAGLVKVIREGRSILYAARLRLARSVAMWGKKS